MEVIMSAQYLPLIGSAYAAELVLGLWLARNLPGLVEVALAWLALG
jgi:hypothetical protein